MAEIICSVFYKTLVHKSLQGPDSTTTTTKKSPSFFPRRQAQLRVHESSQKLQLLRHSLEKCLQENNQRPALQPAGPTAVSGELQSPSGSSRGRLWMSNSPSFPSLRPASLAGTHRHDHTRPVFFSAL